MTLFVFIIVIVVLIFVHELGHFVTAKASGVKVEEFGIGFPPRLIAWKRGETVYSINAVPLGGFTKMTGEEDPADPRSLAGKSIPTRLLVLSSGALMNALLPLLLFAVAFMVPHQVVVGQVAIQEVAPDSPAARAGIRPGDVVLKVKGEPVQNIADLQRLIHVSLGREIPVLLKRPDSTTAEVRVTPRWNPPEGQGATGIMARMLDPKLVSRSHPPWQAIPLGLQEYRETYVLFKNSIVSMFVGNEPVRVTGPVGIAQLTGEVAKAGISPLLEFAAFLSINLAIVNIFPLPALDGGRIVFVLLEWVRGGRRISPRTEKLVHLIGFMMLILAIILVSFYDIARIINGGSLVP
ncbi:MAG: site-2 protease family protein [Chloroflexi bacterium]|nr:site-2 protease family protein [Chloroflexota bacterium]